MNRIYILILLLTTLMISCKKEIVNNATEEVYPNGKVETTLSETGLTEADKIVTVASESEINELIKMLDKMYYKTTTKAQEVGIISHGSCGSYQTLKIRMDCEDDNNASWINYYNSYNSYPVDLGVSKDIKGNFTFTFCLVPNVFHRVGDADFAVLATTLGDYDPGVELWQRLFDTENDNNMDYATLDNINIVGYGDNKFEVVTNGSTSGMELFFAYYPHSEEWGGELPPYPFRYSVFGTEFSGLLPNAELQTDEEDNNCMNKSNNRGNLMSDPWIIATVAPNTFNFQNSSLSQFKVFQVN